MLGHAFERPELLALACVHGSGANEAGDVHASNERLEFLGDAVLDVVVSERLMEASDEAREGVLTRARAAAVNTHSLAECARGLELGRFLRLSHGEERSGGRDKDSILANLFEALIGALYLDGGLPPVRDFVERALGAQLRAPEVLAADPKTQLQERLQARGDPVPRYVATGVSGPDHQREFRYQVRLRDQVLGEGSGGTKQAAQQEAARHALEEMDA